MDAPPPAGKSATTAITNHMARLAREGGAEHIRFLLALRASETHSLPKTLRMSLNYKLTLRKGGWNLALRS